MSSAATSGDADEREADVLSAGLRELSRGRDFSGLGERVISRGGGSSRRGRKVALTFDDGPVLRTYDVLETLESRGARATFFLIGCKVRGHEQLVGRILEGGHEVGNHSYGHAAFPTHEDVAAGGDVLERVSGVRPRFYRPPFGAVDRPTADSARERGMDVVLWSVDSADGTPIFEGIEAEEIVDGVMSKVRPATIVLLHDGLSWSKAAKALPTLIDRLDEEGYELVTVGELLDEDGRANRAPRFGGARPAGAPDLGGVLSWLAEGLQGPAGHSRAAELAAGAQTGLADPALASAAALARHLPGYDNDTARMIALGFSLRRFESVDGGAARPLGVQRTRIADAGDPLAEAAALAAELAAPTRVDRLLQARISEREGSPVDADEIGASSEFLTCFSPGAEVWAELHGWIREAGVDVARRRNRELLDAAGIESSFDFEHVLARLDVEYFLRFGYALAFATEASTALATDR